MERRHSPSVVTALLALLAAPLASAVVVLAQPVTQRGPTPVDISPAPRPAVISHVVLITLNDGADAGALIADCDRLIGTIPSVVSYACGSPLESDRAAVDGSYHVGLFVGFDSAEGYAQYVDHEAHIALVDAWKARTASMRIFDVADPTP
jgi:hypothetical protein